MLAAVVREHGRVDVGEYPDAVSADGEVVVELRAAALNRRDTYVVDGGQPHPLPFVPGSDGAGVRRDTGEEVVILPSLDWGRREDAPEPGFRILGGPDDGTFAELVKVPRANVYPKPRRFSWQEAAALPLAGLTAYRALFARGRLRDGETAVVLGAGSGVSTFLVQLAAGEGARVVVTSSSQEKIDRARELGAAAGVLYTQDGWTSEVCSLCGGGADVVVDSVGSTWPQSLACLRPGGRMVAFGSTGGQEATLAVRSFFFNQHSLLGTTMGSPRDFQGLLRAVDLGSWVPVIDSVRPLEEANDALERLRRGEQFGKVVLTV